MPAPPSPPPPPPPPPRLPCPHTARAQTCSSYTHGVGSRTSRIYRLGRFFFFFSFFIAAVLPCAPCLGGGASLPWQQLKRTVAERRLLVPSPHASPSPNVCASESCERQRWKRPNSVGVSVWRCVTCSSWHHSKT